MAPTSRHTIPGRVEIVPSRRLAPRRPIPLRRLSAIAVAAQLALVLTACSQPEEKRSFALPSDLCGTPVPAAALAAVLPKSGKTLEARASSR